MPPYAKEPSPVTTPSSASSPTSSLTAPTVPLRTPAARERCRMHRLDAGVIVARTCPGCGHDSDYRLVSCTVCSDFSLIMPAEPPRTCRA